MKTAISVIILTYNEKLHIRRCIENIKPIAKEIFVVDCHSTDGTQAIATELGATVIEHDWPGNQAAQMTWALENIEMSGDWILRLDADEYFLPELIDEVKSRLDELPLTTTGVSFKRRVIFLGKWVKRGVYPVIILRLWRKGKAYSRQRLMDEKIELLEGNEVTFNCDFVDHNLNNLSWWTAKHLNYAGREMADLNEANDGTKKKGFYRKMPLFWRATAYFCYRYFIRLGFLDGAPGFLWHFLQGWWYRILIDALIYEDSLKNHKTN